MNISDILIRTKIAINTTFGTQHKYLEELNRITISPSKYEISYQNHFKEQSLQKIMEESPQKLKESVEKDCIESNEQPPKELQEMSPEEFQKWMLHEVEQYNYLQESSLRENSWSSGVRCLSNLLARLSRHAWLLEQDADRLKFEVKGKKLIIYRGDDNILEMEARPKTNRFKTGELDVIIRTPSGTTFDMVQVSQPDRGERLNYNDIHIITWHGFYEVRDNQLLRPVTNLKKVSGERLPIDDEKRHYSLVHERNKIAVPICRFNIPMDLKLKKCINHSDLAVQLDLFILPKGLPWEKYIQLTVYDIYCLFADIIAFDPCARCMTIPVAGGELILNIETFELKLIEGQWDVILRCVYCKDSTMGYNIYFPATLDPDSSLDRGISEGIQDTQYGEEPTQKQLLRDIHNIELKKLGLQ
jgi:hypothetical protein